MLTLINGKLDYALSASRFGNEVGWRSYKYILPADKAGQPDKIIIQYTGGELIENRKQHLYEQKTKEITKDIYQWDGVKFSQLSKGNVASNRGVHLSAP